MSFSNALTPADDADLGQTLDRLVEAVHASLGENLLGLYLVGSFSMGAGDRHSDVDFLVVTRDEIDATSELSLQRAHERLPDLPSHWAQHLEGSYVSAAALREGGHDRWLYVDNGSRVLVRSDHDDTAAFRWVLHEHGVAIIGPPAGSLVDPVPADELRREARAGLRALQETLAGHPEIVENAWAQTHVVGTACRMLFTADRGTVATKAAALRWASGAVDAGWRQLIEQAIADRPDPWTRVHRTADPRLAAETLRFVSSLSPAD